MLKKRAACLWFFWALSGVIYADMSIHLKKYQNTFSIVVSENPTTGYVWSLKDVDDKSLKLVKKDYQANVGDRVGAGGKAIFNFKLLPGFKEKTNVVLGLKRPWEKTWVQQKNYLITKALSQ